MQAEAVDVLADGDSLYVCCKQERGFYFARLLPSKDWQKRDSLPLPFPETPLPKSFKGAF